MTGATTGVHLVDGSGLSSDDRIAPSVYISYLSRFPMTPEGKNFPLLLPANGQGTLGPLGGMPGQGVVRAKTGTLGNVSTLVGYLGRPDGVLVVTLMYNGGCSHTARQEQWRLFRTLGADAVQIPDRRIAGRGAGAAGRRRRGPADADAGVRILLYGNRTGGDESGAWPPRLFGAGPPVPPPPRRSVVLVDLAKGPAQPPGQPAVNLREGAGAGIGGSCCRRPEKREVPLPREGDVDVDTVPGGLLQVERRPGCLPAACRRSGPRG